MTPVKQTRLHSEKTKGNCLQAAVASILDKDIEDVPNFICYGENWFLALILFMRDFGYEYKGMCGAPLVKDEKGIDGYVIASGKSPRGFHHATIYKNGVMVHDPHPDNTGIELEYCYCFEPIGEERESFTWTIR